MSSDQINSSPLEQVQKLSEKNLEYTKEIYKLTKKIQGYLFWTRVMSTLKLLLVIAPIILALIYLPPIIKKTISTYQELLGGKEGASLLIQEQLKKFLEKNESQNLPEEIEKLMR